MVRQRSYWLMMSLLVGFLCAGCSGNEPPTPTRTPVATWTPTPLGADGGAAPAPAQEVAAQPTPAQAVAAPATDTPTSAPPTPTLPPTETPLPTATPTPAATDTPTATPLPTPTPTPEYQFQLEAAEKFPTDSLAPNVVRIYLYVYSPTELGLGGYSLQVIHNGAPLTVDEVSAAGAPDVTRTEPSPYTRFANLNVIFVEPQAGRWDIQLLDPDRQPVGPPVSFDLTADEATRELYVRYKLR